MDQSITKTKKWRIPVNHEQEMGKIFGSWLVLKWEYRLYTNRKKKYNVTHYYCRCRCGREQWNLRGNLIKGKSTQCNQCRIRESKEVGFTRTHGLSKTRTYPIWKNMMNRCYLPTDPCYHLYGKKGIRVCKRWHNIVNFYKDFGEIPKSMTVGRISREKSYTPTNCILIPLRSQKFGKKGRPIFKYKRHTYNLAQIGRLIGFSRQRIGQLLQEFSPEQIIAQYKDRIDESLRRSKHVTAINKRK